MDIAILALTLAGAGAAGGVLAGLLGVGGGIVIVPVLYVLLPFAGIPDELRMHLAVGTSLSTIVATSIISARAHYKRGSVDTQLLKRLAPSIALGVIAGVIFGGQASSTLLTIIFAGVALVVAVHMAFFKDRLIRDDGLPPSPGRDGIGFMIGGISVVMGIGGGTLSVPILTVCGIPIKRAVGTAAAIGLIIAVPGTIGFAIAGWGAPGLPLGSVGYVNLIGFALIAPLSTACAPLGARIAHAIPEAWLARAFALFLLATSLRMFVGVVTGQ